MKRSEEMFDGKQENEIRLVKKTKHRGVSVKSLKENSIISQYTLGYSNENNLINSGKVKILKIVYLFIFFHNLIFLSCCFDLS